MKEKIKTLAEEGNKQNAHLDFLNIGLACHALCLLEQTGLLSKLNKKSGKLLPEAIESVPNPHLLRAALATLIGAKVLKFENNAYVLTELGVSIADNIGVLLLPILGYRNLIAKQTQLLNQPDAWCDSEIDYKAIAHFSINFGVHHLDPLLIDLVKYIQPKGTICDLGCGTAEKLVHVCNETHTNGLGFERCKKVVKESKKFTKKNPKVEVIQADIRNLKGVWEDVELGMICSVLHDINPKEECVEFLTSLKTHFPRMRCLIVVDIVAMSPDHPSIMPGFDYVHGLQGVTPRNYQETRNVFAESNLKVLNEIEVPNMPNTFIWVLKPNNS